jgi:hypothetical protein
MIFFFQGSVMSEELALKSRKTLEESVVAKQEALEWCNSAFIIPIKATVKIQESHITVRHAMLHNMKDKFLSSDYLKKS